VLCSADIALVVLDRSVTSAPNAPVRLHAKPVAGEGFTAVGWGVVEGSSLPPSGSSAAASRSRVWALRRRTGRWTCPCRANDFLTLESICSGDSGGARAGRERRVMGVVSRGGSANGDRRSVAERCTGPTARNVYTSVAPFRVAGARGLRGGRAGALREGESGPPGQRRVEAAPDADADLVGSRVTYRPTPLPETADAGTPSVSAGFSDHTVATVDRMRRERRGVGAPARHAAGPSRPQRRC
jgi:hypothetical protein